MTEFNPLLSPYDMLALGVFDGAYFDDDCDPDFDRKPKIRGKNLFMEGASHPMSVWIAKGWITPEDPRGWFQWYLRYYHGRRLPELDDWQIKRQRSFVARHSAQVCKHGGGDISVRRKQRQGLLHWAADPIPDVDMSDKLQFLKNIATTR